MESDSPSKNLVQMQFQPSGSDVSKVESDVAQTLSLGGAIGALVREPVTLIYQKFAREQEQSRNLGFWKQEALDEHGQCRIPALRTEEFMQYLIDRDGMIPASTSHQDEESFGSNSWFRLPWSARRPGPSSTPSQDLVSAGKARWAYFLYSLGIRPKMSLVRWKPRIEPHANGEYADIQLEVDGSVLCHMINLYSTVPYTRGLGRRLYEEVIPNRHRKRCCDFAFGQLAWDDSDGQIHASFTPGSEPDLMSEKQAFGAGAKFAGEGTTMATYLCALNDRVSDSRYSLPSPQVTEVSERIHRLLACFRLLRNRTDDEKTLLITHDWFEQAARIKRRALTKNGDDNSFCYDSGRRLAALLRERFRRSGGDYEHAGQEEISKRFLLDGGKFYFVIPPDFDDRSPSQMNDMVARTLKETLSSYDQEPEDSFKRELFEMREDILKVALLPPEVEITPRMNVRLVEFTSSSSLWDKKVLLGGTVQ